MKRFWTIALTVVSMLVETEPAMSQVHYSIGLFNAGEVAQEKTHHVRIGAMGRDVYLGVGIDLPIADHTLLAFKGTYMPTQLAMWPCDSAGCEKLSRWDHRPRAIVRSFPMSWTTIGAGLRRELGPLRVAAGGSVNIIHAADYQFWGSIPMMTGGLWGELRGELPIKGASVGLELGTAVIPPQKSRYTVLDDAGGGKLPGKPHTEKLKTIHAVYAGVVVRPR